jgi:hypothetical protein
LDKIVLVGSSYCPSIFQNFIDRAGADCLAVLQFPDSEERSKALRESLKTSRFLVVYCGESQSRILADELWHLLRQKIVISLAPKLSLAALRDLYPLSKVSRLAFCINADVEMNLAILAADNTLSNIDLTTIKEILSNLGEVLVVSESVFDAIVAHSKISESLFSGLVTVLKESPEINADICEYVLGWILYGVGNAAIKGKLLSDLLTETVPEKSRSLLKEAVREAKAYIEK